MKILLTCWGSFGEIIPIVAMSRQLIAHGHEVHICGPEDSERGFGHNVASYTKIFPRFESPAHLQVFTEQIFKFNIGWRSVSDVINKTAEQNFNLVSDIIKQHKIDFAFSSWTTPATALACKKHGVPFQEVCLYPMALYQETDPPVMPRWPRITDVRRPIDIRQKARLDVASAYRAMLPDLRALTEAQGFDPDTFDLFKVTTPRFGRLAAFPRRLMFKEEAGVHYLKNFWSNLKPRLHESIIEFLTHGEPAILITLGSLITTRKSRLFDTVLNAVEKLDQKVVVLLGNGTKEAYYTAAGSLILGNARLSSIAPYCKLIIHHGGINSITETLGAGLPSICLPMSFDQFDNARRLQRLNLGDYIIPEKLQAEALASAINSVLMDDKIRASADKWRTDDLLSEGLDIEEALSLGLAT